MPVAKPIQSFGAGMPVIKRARESALEQRNAANALPGLDNFARLLKSDPQTAARSVQSQVYDSGAGQTAQGASLQQGVASLMNKVNISLNPEEAQNLQSMNLLQRVMQQSNNPLAIVNSLNPLGSARPQGDEAALLALRTQCNRVLRNGKNILLGKEPAVEAIKPEPAKPEPPAPEKQVGLLSAFFEAGKDGIATIGYDRNGGTSYGQYQISSKSGTMDRFISFLTNKAADLAKRLKAAGPSNTGGRGGKMPQVWKELAAEDPERFSALQHEFINVSHFKPALNKIKAQTGLTDSDFSPAMLEVVFSTAVQHGVGAAGRIINRALESVGLDKFKSANEKESLRAEEEAIKGVYKHRSRQFVSSTKQVREAVQGRLRAEMNMALNMLQEKLRV